MRRLRLLVLASLVALAGACSGETSGGGSGGTGGASAAGGTSSSGGTSGAGGSSLGGSSSGGASGTGATASGGGGSSGSDGSTSGGGSGGGVDAGGACQEGGTLDAGIETVIAQACVVAVVRVLRIDEECSGAGGAHVTFDVIAIGKGSGVTKVNHGGHAYYAPPEGPDKVGEYFVAGIDPFGKLVPQPDNPGWCITGLPSVDGWAHSFVQAASEADAKTKMAAILAK